jgi:hypothetical protein
MNARDTVLTAVRRNLPRPAVPLPDVLGMPLWSSPAHAHLNFRRKDPYLGTYFATLSFSNGLLQRRYHPRALQR